MVTARLQRAIDEGDFEGTRTQLAAAREWSEEELEWLMRNQPRDCYREVHSGWGAVVTTYGQGFAILESALDPSDAVGQRRGVGYMIHGVRQAGELVAVIERASC